MKYEAVIFDLFGTLVDNFTREAFTCMLAEMAAVLNAPQEAFLRLWMDDMWPMRATGKLPTMEDYVAYSCEKLNLRVRRGKIKEAARIHIAFARQTLVPRVDTVETLRTLRAAGYKIGLISDCTAEVPFLWSTTPFDVLIDAALFSCKVGVRKPDPYIYYLVCRQLNVRPQQCLYLGDGGSRELTGAAAVGMHPVLIRAHEDLLHPMRLDAEEWDGVKITSVKELLPLVDGIVTT